MKFLLEGLRKDLLDICIDFDSSKCGTKSVIGVYNCMILILIIAEITARVIVKNGRGEKGFFWKSLLI